MKAMVIFGHLRIGTLRDFQNEEEYGTEIGDSGEGTKTLYEDNASFQWGHNVPPIAKKIIHYHDNVRNVVFRNCTLSP